MFFIWDVKVGITELLRACNKIPQLLPYPSLCRLQPPSNKLFRFEADLFEAAVRLGQTSIRGDLGSLHKWLLCSPM